MIIIDMRVIMIRVNRIIIKKKIRRKLSVTTRKKKRK